MSLSLSMSRFSSPALVRHRLPLSCLGLVLAVFIWSAICPFDRFTWWLEVAPVLVVVPLLLASYARFRLTGLLYALIALHAVILMIGGHYSYARVPGFDQIGQMLGSNRNSYDGVGHLAQGFIPAISIRELLLRTSPLRSGKWLFVLIVFSCLGISALYEIIEWATAHFSGENAADFLGTQGDIWDTQKDMALAGVGALTALLCLGKWHDRHILRMTNYKEQNT
ncbi:MAG: hypothetical protein JWM96_1219 [Alphaproteobacteria bacterium]|nr:hypothetical protein [Alphaproteobacteria bacterium]